MNTIKNFSSETACESVKATLLPSVAGVVVPSNMSVKNPFAPEPPILPQESVYPSKPPVVVLYLNIPACAEPDLCAVVPFGSVTEPVPLSTTLSDI